MPSVRPQEAHERDKQDSAEPSSEHAKKQGLLVSNDNVEKLDKIVCTARGMLRESQDRMHPKEAFDRACMRALTKHRINKAEKEWFQNFLHNMLNDDSYITAAAESLEERPCTANAMYSGYNAKLQSIGIDLQVEQAKDSDDGQKSNAGGGSGSEGGSEGHGDSSDDENYNNMQRPTRPPQPRRNTIMPNRPKHRGNDERDTSNGAAQRRRFSDETLDAVTQTRLSSSSSSDAQLPSSDETVGWILSEMRILLERHRGRSNNNSPSVMDEISHRRGSDCFHSADNPPMPYRPWLGEMAFHEDLRHGHSIGATRADEQSMPYRPWLDEVAIRGDLRREDSIDSTRADEQLTPYRPWPDALVMRGDMRPEDSLDSIGASEQLIPQSPSLEELEVIADGFRKGKAQKQLKLLAVRVMERREEAAKFYRRNLLKKSLDCLYNTHKLNQQRRNNYEELQETYNYPHRLKQKSFSVWRNSNVLDPDLVRKDRSRVFMMTMLSAWHERTVTDAEKIRRFQSRRCFKNMTTGDTIIKSTVKECLGKLSAAVVRSKCDNEVAEKFRNPRLLQASSTGIASADTAIMLNRQRILRQAFRTLKYKLHCASFRRYMNQRRVGNSFHIWLKKHEDRQNDEDKALDLYKKNAMKAAMKTAMRKQKEMHDYRQYLEYTGYLARRYSLGWQCLNLLNKKVDERNTAKQAEAKKTMRERHEKSVKGRACDSLNDMESQRKALEEGVKAIGKARAKRHAHWRFVQWEQATETHAQMQDQVDYLCKRRRARGVLSNFTAAIQPARQVEEMANRVQAERTRANARRQQQRLVGVDHQRKGRESLVHSSKERISEMQTRRITGHWFARTQQARSGHGTMKTTLGAEDEGGEEMAAVAGNEQDAQSVRPMTASRTAHGAASEASSTPRAYLPHKRPNESAMRPAFKVLQEQSRKNAAPQTPKARGAPSASLALAESVASSRPARFSTPTTAAPSYTTSSFSLDTKTGSTTPQSTPANWIPDIRRLVPEPSAMRLMMHNDDGDGGSDDNSDACEDANDAGADALDDDDNADAGTGGHSDTDDDNKDEFHTANVGTSDLPLTHSFGASAMLPATPRPANASSSTIVNFPQSLPARGYSPAKHRGFERGERIPLVDATEASRADIGLETPRARFDANQSIRSGQNPLLAQTIGHGGVNPAWKTAGTFGGLVTPRAGQTGDRRSLGVGGEQTPRFARTGRSSRWTAR